MQVGFPVDGRTEDDRRIIDCHHAAASQLTRIPREIEGMCTCDSIDDLSRALQKHTSILHRQPAHDTDDCRDRFRHQN